MLDVEGANRIFAALFSGQVALAFGVAFAAEDGVVILAFDQAGKGFGEVGALVVAAVDAMEEGAGHWQDEVDCGDVEAHIERGKKPTHKVVAHPEVAIEFIVEDNLACLAFKAEDATCAVECGARGRVRAILAQVIAFKPNDGPPANRATSHLRNKWDAHQARGANVPRRLFHLLAADFTHPRPNEVKTVLKDIHPHPRACEFRSRQRVCPRDT